MEIPETLKNLSDKNREKLNDFDNEIRNGLDRRLANNMRKVRQYCLDNGMNRNNYDIEEADEVIEFIKSLQLSQVEN